MKKPVVLSGSTTSGDLTIGNYIGAITQWVRMVQDYDAYFMVANLHSLTAYQDPKNLLARTESFFAQYIALGLDPAKCTLFVQSQVPEHAELQWVLSCITPMGNLQRMTQFKDKTANAKQILSGLLMYPVLMAADILLYKADFVPVGQDQKQHLELCRDIVEYFRDKYGDVFVMPKPMIPERGARIMSLADPDKKMSKSDTDPNGAVSVLDDAKVIEKKFKKAVTDSGTRVAYNEENKGIANLMTIYSVFTGKDMAAIEKEFDGKMYGHLKVGLAEVVIETLKPVQQRYKDLMNDRTHLQSLMNAGAERARARAGATLKQVYEAMGIVTG
jgi:tryptophanyl-tRNA synthetase